MYWTFVPKTSQKDDAYWFVNEHEIRIATWVTLVLGLFSLFLVLFRAEYTIPLYLVSLIFLDFCIKVFISPKYSPFGAWIRLFLRKKDPLWVGAVQKRFAWTIGLIISTIVVFCLMIQSGSFIEWGGPFHMGHQEYLKMLGSLNITESSLIVVPINPPIILCILCLVFMWSESVVWYCIWCSIYAWMVRKWWVKWHKNQNCIDGRCEI